MIAATCLMMAWACLAQTERPLPFGARLDPTAGRANAAAEPGQAQADTLVICPPALVDGLAPWIEYRQGQGHRVTVRSDCSSVGEMRAAVRAVARQGALRYVLLVGDVQHDAAQRATHLPTYLARAEVNIHWGSEPELATDNWFADVNDDVVPDVAIGRWPVQSAGELAALIDKTIAYERHAPQGAWRRRVNLIAGVGGFGVLADAVLETATRTFIQQGIPESYRTSMTYASWRSPYCPDPRQFRGEVIQRMNEGCLCWVYIGHGQRQGLDWVRVPIGAAPIFEKADVARLQCVQGPPIAVFLSCYGAAFDGAEDCLSEQMLRHAQGPVAVIGGTRMTMPYGMAVLSQAMMHEMFQIRARTLGDVLLVAKQKAMVDPAQGGGRWLDSIARVLNPKETDLAAERREHVMLFHLLGDPLMRLHHPRSVELDVARSATAGEELTVRWRGDVAGDGVIELACRRGQLPFRAEPRLAFDGTDEGMRALSDVYARANDDVLVRKPFRTTELTGAVRLPVPEDVRGMCTVRVFLEGSDGYALGASTVHVGKRQATEPAATETREVATPD